MASVDKVVDVAVVGAGLAGLRTAELLVSKGLTVAVVDARDRVGGRTLTKRIGGAALDLGGQWIGPDQHRIRALAKRLEIALHPTWHEGKKVLELGGRRTLYGGDIPSISVANLLELQVLLTRIRKRMKTVDPAAPWTCQNAAKWDRLTVEQWKTRSTLGKSTRAMVDLLIRSVWSVEPSEMSMLYFLSYAASAGDVEALTKVVGGAQQDRLVGGAQQLCQRLAEPLGDSVFLNEPVREIVVTDRRVEVACRTLTVGCRRVVVALSPMLSSRIAFSPALPPRRDQMAQRMPMGATIKCLALYDRPFWRDDGLSGEALSHEGVVSFVYDNTSEGGLQPNLVAFVTGDRARDLSDQPATLKARVLGDLARLMGAPASHPVHFEAFDWSADPWSSGCPVGVGAPGALTGGKASLRQPFGPIHWAGTETATQWCGYMEGALQSAERAAAEVTGLLGQTGSRRPA